MRETTLGLGLAAVLLFGSGCKLDFDMEGHCFAGECAGDSETATPPDAAREDDATGTVEDAEDDAGTPADPDQDGVIDPDNCPSVWNPTQLDYDGDFAGDECDACPFLSGKSTLQEGESCYEAFDPDQVVGQWKGFATYYADKELTILPLDITMGAKALVTGGHELDAKLNNGGIWHLGGLIKSGGVSTYDALLVVDRKREIAAGHLMRPKDMGASLQGLAAPANIVVLVRRRQFVQPPPWCAGLVSSQCPVPEAVLAAGKAYRGEDPRRWHLSGWLYHRANILTKLLYAFRGSVATHLLWTPVSGWSAALPAMEVGAHDAEAGTGIAYMNALGQGAVSHDFAANLVFQPGGKAPATMDWFRMAVPFEVEDAAGGQKLEAQLLLDGQMSISGGFAVLSMIWQNPSPGAEDEVRAFLILTEKPTAPVSAPASDPRKEAHYALLGMHQYASMRGYIPAGVDTGEPLGLLFHTSEPVMVGGTEEMQKTTLASSFAGIDLMSSFDVPLAEKLGQFGKGIESPRVCLGVGPGSSHGFVTLCEPGGKPLDVGCPIDMRCLVPAGIALEVNQLVTKNDFDLDGKPSSSQPVGCTSSGQDSCPCLLNPDFDCPGDGPGGSSSP